MDVVVAAFDVDNTLTVRDCVVPFMQRISGRIGFATACLSDPVRMTKMVLRRDRDSIKAHFVDKVFAGKNVEDVNQQGVAFASHVVGSLMRKDVAQRMRWHQAQGHVVVLVSASLEPYLQPFGDLCEVDAVLCTRLEEANGTFTGKILGNNCRGDEKVARVREWMSTSGLPAEALMYAYGDSSGDTALLAAAKNGYLVTKMDDAEEFA
jgi:phosphatidylglycerophosphatase C